MADSLQILYGDSSLCEPQMGKFLGRSAVWFLRSDVRKKRGTKTFEKLYLARFLNALFDIADIWYVGVIGCAESNGVVIIHVTRHVEAGGGADRASRVL